MRAMVVDVLVAANVSVNFFHTMVDAPTAVRLLAR
jgi:hypothetical protein